MADYERGVVSRRRWPTVVFVTVILIAIIMGTAVAITRRVYTNNLKPVNASQKHIIVTIASGESVKGIATILKNQGLIRSTLAFEQYIRAQDLTSNLKAGTYVLQPSQSVAEIVSVITEGKIKTDLVTILPGSRIDQVRKALIQDGFTATDVDKALQPSLYKNHPALVDIPDGVSLEGYLYPESFQKTATTTPGDIIRLSLDQMQKHLTPDLRAAIEKQGLTVYQGIILASVIEQEAPDPATPTTASKSVQAQVAQVFLKRFRSNMVLGSDVTVIYGAIAAGQTPSLTYDSAYNTHLHVGLPAGPISNVTDAALQAVAHPAGTDWLYFVAGDDGVTYFSKTLEEHQALTAEHCKRLCS
jgi:UPF0755 protein